MKPGKYAHHAEMLDRDRTVYANRWNEKNAAHLERNQYYDWMGGFLNDYPLILEIGTGTGQSTVSLLRKGHTVVGIDENPKCLQIAEENIKNSGFDVEIKQRGIVAPQYYGYNLKYRFLEGDIIENGALLVEGDVSNDPVLGDWLIKRGSFDAVICWLIGTHNGRQANKVIINNKIADDGTYRLFTQNQVYELADKVLKKDGILQIIDRGERTSDQALVDEAIEAHQDQASTTSLNIESVEMLPYEDSTERGSQPMIITPGLSGRVPKEIKMSLWSVISRKP